MTNGIQPTVELATTNGNVAYPYPVYPAMNGGYGNSGFFGSEGIWIILLLALLFNGGWGNNGGFFGGNNFDNGYAWLSNGQKEIMQNTNNGFDTLHLSNNIEGVRDGVYGLSNQLCNSTASVVSAVNNGFSNAEISANARQIADMNQNFNNTISTLNGFNGIQKSLDSCCCENRLGIERLNATILSENCADREALSNGIRDIISSQTASTQRILDQLCNDKIDEKNSKIADLQREILMKDLQASQTAQTATLRLGQQQEADLIYERLRNCPVGTVPVFGNQPIFTCSNNVGGCGCNGNYYSTGFYN